MKSIFLVFIPFLLKANENDVQKLMAERAQLEAVSSQLQSEIRSATGERDRTNEKILNIQDEITETKRKLSEAKEKRAQFLTRASGKRNDEPPVLNKQDLQDSIKHYETFVSQGIPWDIQTRLDKIQTLKTALNAAKEPISESTLQWSQFLEAERKLASETQRHLRRIKIENIEHDAAVFRMGLTLLYYKTAHGDVGVFYRKNHRLFHQQLNDETVKNKIAHLVEMQNEKNTEKLLSELVLTSGMVRTEVL
ncbi:MAG: DUF3450 family protein [Bdellovibrionaceae bacterium]|nr:DUF3450 family protein [Pseudobdellovibrionaceae bacterium]